MKVVVTYASCGTGHFKAAQAICNCLKKDYPSFNICLVDILEKTNPFFGLFYRRSYSFLVNKAIFLWRIVFWVTNLKHLCHIAKFIGEILNRFNAANFIRFIAKEKPDFIISTHFLPSELSGTLRKSGRIKSRIISVITDFDVHPYWVSEGIDLYVVASDYTKEKLLLHGVLPEAIKVFGIPVDPRFLQTYAKEEVCLRLGIKKDKFTVLIMTGSFGIGPIEEIVEILHKDLQLLVVCALNKSLYARLKKNYPSDIKVFGFVDNVAELMAASDVIIAKPGGLSISEILAMELVPIFISAIPGQETANVQMLRSCGVGLSPAGIKELREAVLDYSAHPEKLSEIKERMRRIKKPNALEDICHVIR
jgi:processive 1,2-diacylglycerol beta-glucosyltransferase